SSAYFTWLPLTSGCRARSPDRRTAVAKTDTWIVAFERGRGRIAHVSVRRPLVRHHVDPGCPKGDPMRDLTATKPARLGWVLTLTSTAYFMVVLDSVVVITALPRMQRDLHVSLSSLQWTLNAYGIAFAAGIITAAALGDRLGRRRVFTIGLALFTLASVACALAPNLSELIVARVVHGLGGAVVLPLSLTILTSAFPVGRRGMIVGI